MPVVRRKFEISPIRPHGWHMPCNRETHNQNQLESVFVNRDQRIASEANCACSNTPYPAGSITD